MNAQQRNLVTLGGAVVVAGALGLYAYYGVMKPEEHETERKEASDRLVSAQAPGEKAADGGELPPPEFTAITIEAKGEKTTLTRRDDQWWITAPVEVRADEQVVGPIVSQLQTSKVKEQLEEKPNDAELKRYGLAPPAFTVRATSGGKEYVVEGGVENSFDGTVYLRKGGDPAVYSAPGTVRSSMEKTTYELRDKQPLTVAHDTVQKLEVKLDPKDPKAGGISFTAVRTGDDWRLTAPKDAQADRDTLTNVIENLSTERALSYPTDTPDIRQGLGFDSPAEDITYTQGNGATIRIRLVSKAGKTYALREEAGRGTLAELGQTALAHARKNLDELLDKTVVPFDREAVARLAFRPAKGGAAITVEKEASDGGPQATWRVTSPEQGPAKQWKISSLLWALSNLRAKSLPEEKTADWKKYGITDSSQAVEAYDAGGKLVAKVQFGKDDPKDAGYAYARGAKPGVVTVEKNRISDFPSAASDLIEKPVLIDAGLPDFATAPH